MENLSNHVTARLMLTGIIYNTTTECHATKPYITVCRITTHSSFTTTLVYYVTSTSAATPGSSRSTFGSS